MCWLRRIPEPTKWRMTNRADKQLGQKLSASTRNPCWAESLFRRLSSETRSEFPSCFHTGLLLGHSPCHKEDQVPVVLIHFGKQRQEFPHQQCPGSRRFQEILRARFCGLRESGRFVTI